MGSLLFRVLKPGWDVSLGMQDAPNVYMILVHHEKHEIRIPL
jgi:hypothetical protein